MTNWILITKLQLQKEKQTSFFLLQENKHLLQIKENWNWQKQEGETCVTRSEKGFKGHTKKDNDNNDPENYNMKGKKKSKN